jgi:hypothetical protein
MAVALVSRAPALVPVVAARTEYIDNGDKRPSWLGADGQTIYSWGQTGLYTSIDDAHTWQGPWHTFPDTIHGVRETRDGELLVSIFRAQGNYAGLWRSTGWTANHATATWTEVLTPSGQLPNVADPATFPAPAGTLGDRSNYFNAWIGGFRVYADGTVVVSEYGKQANGTSIPGARYAFVSNDNGKPGTWRCVCDLWTGPVYGVGWVPGTLPYGGASVYGGASGGQHMHGTALDPYTGRLWATFGDHGCHTRYSDDWRRVFSGENATWTVHPGSSTEFGGQGNHPGSTQSIQAYAFPDRIVFTTDGPIDGITKIEKANPNVIGVAHDIGLPHDTQLKYTGGQGFQRSSAHPALFPQYVGSGGTRSFPGLIVACDPLGERWYDIWTDNQALQNPYGVLTAIGPTNTGKLLASIALDGRSAGQVANTAGLTMLRADFPVIL